MKQSAALYLLLSLLTLSVLLVGCGHSTEPEVFPLNPQPQTSSVRFRSAVETGVDRFELPGIAAGLWQPGQPPTIVVQGFSDLENARAMSPEDHFRIGSVTKSFTVTVLLQLVQEQRLSLDDPISDYLPTLQNPSATLAELANMKSGIFNYTEDQDFILELVQDFERSWTEQELLDTADRNTPYFPPGKDWHYSNTNTVALGLVIEQVTGNSLATEIENRILFPLALGGTSYPDTVAMPTPFAKGYGLFEPDEGLQDLTLSSPSSSAGSGAMVSRLEDLRAWGEALGSGSLLSPEMQELRLQMVPTDSCPECPEYDGYGLGIGTLSGWLGHTGDYIGYQALVMYQPDTGAAAVILVNLKNFTAPDHIPTEIFQSFTGS